MGLAKDMLFSSREAGHYLNVSERHVCRLCRQGRILAYRVSSVWVISGDEIARWLKRPKAKAGQPRKIQMG
jgi:excisionase family DNA binding protein